MLVAALTEACVCYGFPSCRVIGLQHAFAEVAVRVTPVSDS